METSNNDDNDNNNNNNNNNNDDDDNMIINIIDYLLDDDIIIEIISYLQKDLFSIQNLGYVNKYFANLLFINKKTNTNVIFGNIYGRQYYKNLYNIRRLFPTNTPNPNDNNNNNNNGSGGGDSNDVDTTTTTIVAAAAAAAAATTSNNNAIVSSSNDSNIDNDNNNNNCCCCYYYTTSKSIKNKGLNRLKILSHQDEQSSMYFDHINHFRQQQQQDSNNEDSNEDGDLLATLLNINDNKNNNLGCSGYFGFIRFPITKEIAVIGDYSGMSFLPNLNSFLNPILPNNTNGTLFGESYQVMAVCIHDNYLFLGFASGEVHCISMVTTPTTTLTTTTTTKNNHDGSSKNGNDIKEQQQQQQQQEEMIQEYPYLSGNTQHKHELSSLSRLGTNDLVSVSVANEYQIIIHYDALTTGDVNLRTRKVHINTSGSTILSLASTTITNINNDYTYHQ